MPAEPDSSPSSSWAWVDSVFGSSKSSLYSPPQAMLAAMGYVANQAQSDASRLGIVLSLTVIPGVVALLAAWVMRFYPLDDAALARIQDELRQRREAQA